MKLLTILLLLGATHLTAQVTPATGTPGGDNQRKRPAKVEGKMVNSTSGMPVGRVTLTLRSDDSAQALKFIATSDTEGSFVFDHVEPGRYTLYGEKPGFLQEYYRAGRATGRGTPLTLSEGQLMKELLFKLTPQGVISGKATDETGEPMDKVSIMVMRWGYSRGRRRLLPVGGALSNDLGDYRIANLKPGTYYLSAHRMASTVNRRILHADVPTATLPETPEESYQTTYYPSSIDPAGAGALQVAPGSELRGVDIRFRKTRVFHVRAATKLQGHHFVSFRV